MGETESDECTHVIVEQSMKPNMTKAQLTVATLQLLLPIDAQREQRTTAANSVFPRMLER